MMRERLLDPNELQRDRCSTYSPQITNNDSLGSAFSGPRSTRWSCCLQRQSPESELLGHANKTHDLVLFGTDAHRINLLPCVQGDETSGPVIGIFAPPVPTFGKYR